MKSGRTNTFSHPFRQIWLNKGRTCLGWAAVSLILGSVFSACASPTVSLQPEIKSISKEGSADHYRGKIASDNVKTVDNLPEMNTESHEALGDAMMARGDFRSAYSHYQKAFEKTAGHKQSRLKYKQGLSLLYTDQLNPAMDCFESVLARDPDYAPAYQGIGRIHFKRGEIGAAKEQFQKAVALKVELWHSQIFLGTIFDNEGAWKQAENAYKKALAANPREGSILNNLGTSYLLAGKNDLAAQMFELAIRYGYTEGRVFNNLGLALAKAGRFDAALQAFTTAVGKAGAYNNLGCVHLKNGRRRMAIECFEKAMALDAKFYLTASENLKKASMPVNSETGGIQ